MISTALSIPGATILTLVAGRFFGFWFGLLFVSFASTLGATLAFLVSRFVIGDSIREKYGEKLQDINRKLEKEGPFYLFSMRLIPAIPFFLINLLMGLTPIRGLDLLVGQPGGNARRHHRLCLRRFPDPHPGNPVRGRQSRSILSSGADYSFYCPCNISLRRSE